MKWLKHSLPLLLLSAVFAVTSMQVFAVSSAKLQDQASQALLRLEIMQKDKKGSLRLRDKAKRYEFVTFVNAAMSYDVDADSEPADIQFKDLTSKHIAYKQIRTAAAHGLISAYKDGTIRPDKTITSGDAAVILLKALGYNEEISGLDNEGILKKAAELGITGPDSPKFDDPLTRGNAAIYIYNFMTIDFNE